MQNPVKIGTYLFFGAKNSGQLVEHSGELARVLGLEIRSRKN